MDVQEMTKALSTLGENQDYDAAVAAYAELVPDPRAFLAERGIELPADAEITVRVHAGAAVGAERKGDRVCWEICVGPSWARYCYEKCHG